jgi:hypothetical protein
VAESVADSAGSALLVAAVAATNPPSLAVRTDTLGSLVFFHPHFLPSLSLQKMRENNSERLSLNKNLVNASSEAVILIRQLAEKNLRDPSLARLA